MAKPEGPGNRARPSLPTAGFVATPPSTSLCCLLLQRQQHTGRGGGAGGDHHTRACAPVDRVLNASRPPTVSRTLPWKAKGPIPPYKSRVPPAPKPLDNSGSDEATAPVGPHQRPQVAATGLGLGGAKQAALPPEHTGSPERPTGRPAPDNGALFPRRPRSTPARQAALLGRGKGREPPGRGRRGRASGSPGLRRGVPFPLLCCCRLERLREAAPNSSFRRVWQLHSFTSRWLWAVTFLETGREKARRVTPRLRERGGGCWQ